MTEHASVHDALAKASVDGGFVYGLRDGRIVVVAGHKEARDLLAAGLIAASWHRVSTHWGTRVVSVPAREPESDETGGE